MRILLFLLPLFLFAAPVRSAAFSPAGDSLPIIVCPTNIVVVAVAGECSAAATYSVTASDDDPGYTVAQTTGLPSGADFPAGITVNNFMVTDVDGNTATCSFRVTVKDLVPPVALCNTQITVTLGPDDPNDCFDGPVVSLPVSLFDAGSYDDCGFIRLAIRRTAPFTDCILDLNNLNGQPDCHDVFLDFPTEFETGVMEQDSIKFYCCEGGLSAPGNFGLELRAYQMYPNNTPSLDLNGKVIFGKCNPTVTILPDSCPPPTPFLNGYLALDEDKDCTPDNSPFGLPPMTVRALTPAGDTLYTTANGSQGLYYTFGDQDSGTYVVEVFPPAPIWQICDNPDTVVIFPANGIQTHSYLGVQLETDCPVLYTDVAGWFLRPCSTSTWVVKNCNVGGSAATDTYLQLLIDDQLTLIGASEPYTLLGDTVEVQLGDLAAGECREVSLSLQVPCTQDIVGQSLCLEAHLFPDTLCLPLNSNWSGAQIEASAVCLGDSTLFTLTNTGAAPTSTALDYIVIDDMVIMREGILPAGFAPGAVQTETLYADGQTQRIISQQEPGHPVALIPSQAVENCNGLVTASQMLTYLNEDGDPFTETYCRQVTTSYDPNEKLAFPTGYSDAHLIGQNIPLAYQLNFQNTGNDTAFLVVLRDTISGLLDPATLRMGASSHPYTWKLEGAGVLTVRFENIRLPDSTTSEAGSHGFVQFDIAQKRDNPLGSVIQNRAGIYFDINEVVLTNTVFHTIGKNFVTSGTAQPVPEDLLKVYPNPAAENIFVPLQGDARVLLSDMLGRPLRQYSGKAPGLTIRREGLADGMYWLEVRPAAGENKAGKVMWLRGE